MLARRAVDPVGTAVINDRAAAGNPFDGNLDHPPLEQLRKGDTETLTGFDEMHRVKRRQVHGIPPANTEMRHLPAEHRLPPVIFRPLTLEDVRMDRSQLIQRVESRAPEIVRAEVIEERHNRRLEAKPGIGKSAGAEHLTWNIIATMAQVSRLGPYPADITISATGGRPPTSSCYAKLRSPRHQLRKVRPVLH